MARARERCLMSIKPDDINAAGGPLAGKVVPLPVARPTDAAHPDALPLDRYAKAAIAAPDLVTRNIPKPSNLLGDGVLVAGGFAVLYSKPGCGKTWIALLQARELVRGI